MKRRQPKTKISKKQRKKMKWAGIDKLGIFLYLAISLFAIANIYSVDEGLGTKQFIFLEFHS